MVWPKEPLGSLAIKATFGQNQTVLGEYGESTSDGRFSPAGRATQVAMHKIKIASQWTRASQLILGIGPWWQGRGQSTRVFRLRRRTLFRASHQRAVHLKRTSDRNQLQVNLE
ncbi:uncharacterized protein TERG_12031 [Trichophyton rubrum CBS 118892]|uniref:Uncharacterized protein n=1 Tax=Trichophyton rubrum (strain ATCC MYA-4607 / CBS 118892) TaxID=559305 RepID=A0A080WSY4_TRIRC|nr:uncharacterized protein TERG_12031 [Trichophyton rubrum CBS 118892]KFL61273.1 hypothetical protein TERG_12031 [Trichophyton rubrum CBS 118892]